MADTRIRLDEYSFPCSRKIHIGRRTVGVENRGKQVLHAAIAPGLVHDSTAECTPGAYALISFIPDASDGPSHAQHGMLRQLRVRGARC